MSISPLNVGTNTYSTALLIGERAAIIIAEDFGYQLYLISIVRDVFNSEYVYIWWIANKRQWTPPC
ncbi:hypothetical protein BDR07DRAFT_1401568 [Suillus spraguei]|nr:hypothetical protein BDR07DRAFT_1401568 [Suillus spraguei]